MGERKLESGTFFREKGFVVLVWYTRKIGFKLLAFYFSQKCRYSIGIHVLKACGNKLIMNFKGKYPIFPMRSLA